MALVAKMTAQKIEQLAGKRWEPCDEGDEGATPVEVAYENYHYGPPVWLADASFVRQVPGVASEAVQLNCVIENADDPDDRRWFEASPTGQLTLTMQNPEGFGYIKAGRKYRVTIEEIRGPRSTVFTINGREYRSSGAESITYEDIVRYAGKTGQPTVTWHRDGRGGSMLPGDDVSITPGLHFDCVHTGNA